VSDGPGTTKIASSNRGNCGGYLPHLLPGYVSLRMANRFKERGDLEIETADMMGFLLRWLLYFRCFCPSMWRTQTSQNIVAEGYRKSFKLKERVRIF